MNQSLCILGRQPLLGLAELESLYGAEILQPVGTQAVVIDKEPSDIDFDRLGGSTRLCQVLATLSTTEWPEIEKRLSDLLPDNLPSGKLQIGLSAFDLSVSPQALNASGLKLKKVVRSRGHSMRFIPNQTQILNAAQVLHNHLTGPSGLEFVLVRDSSNTIVAKTIAIQDITSYTLRDRGRPKRDARVGMLPPKLAQIIINLAVSSKDSGWVLDPFCGSGVIPQEALLMSFSAYATDIEPRMVDYTKVNLEWLENKYKQNKPTKFDVGDATSFKWAKLIDFVASETYLGRPLTAIPNSELLAKTVSECNTILKKFLQNINSQLEPGTRLCLAMPAWQVSQGRFKHLPLIDQLSDLGYNRVSFKQVRSEDLLYYRENQIVARELLVLIRK